MQALDRAQGLLASWQQEVLNELPADVAVFDAHVHLGDDIDGMRGRPDELLGMMDDYRVDRAFMFCLDEPDRHPSFRAPNDRTLAYARESNGRLIPFVRLDLNEDPVAEANRVIDAGARGIKLHPRAQKISLQDERLTPVFQLACDRNVPILIHGGRGLPPIADGLARLVERNPDAALFIAHAGIADMAHLTEAMAGRPNVFFDTSTWSAVDLLDLYRRVPPEQVVYASDFPYGQQPGSLFIALRSAKAAGLAESQITAMLGGTANALADGRDLPVPTRPCGEATLSQPLQLARIHQYLSMAMPLLWMRQQDTIGVLGLALNTCAERDGQPDTADRISELLRTATELWRKLPELEDESDRFRVIRTAQRLIHIADVEAVTSA